MTGFDQHLQPQILTLKQSCPRQLQSRLRELQYSHSNAPEAMSPPRLAGILTHLTLLPAPPPLPALSMALSLALGLSPSTMDVSMCATPSLSSCPKLLPYPPFVRLPKAGGLMPSPLSMLPRPKPPLLPPPPPRPPKGLPLRIGPKPPS